MIRAATAIAMSFVVSCSGAHSIPGGKTGDGYTVHLLGGDSLTAAAVTINGRSIDTSSVEAIEATVQRILDSAPAVRTVEEVAGQAPDLAVDFTGAATAVPPTFHGANLQWRSKFFLRNPRWRALVAHMKPACCAFPAVRSASATTDRGRSPARRRPTR